MPTSGTVFIAGSIAISRLHPVVCDRIGNAVDRDMAVVVGDADGADTAIQRVLLVHRDFMKGRSTPGSRNISSLSFCSVSR